MTELPEGVVDLWYPGIEEGMEGALFIALAQKSAANDGAWVAWSAEELN